MSTEPTYKEWEQISTLLKTAIAEEKEDLFLKVLMTQDERSALITRINIINELLRGELSQRQISQMLGVGVATITRGSNELKQQSDQSKAWLSQLLDESK
ncbi:trp operon repressor [Vibrio sp. SS-MA-C1-2]|uniref:trp operon repressor n=1 Tax=Vibrio sp. SS-MA-C1-2 TaxID=2908646 RepID=UPI001F3A2764|nr:trp operon repressor [Vibrio sp. SS-MA-C1-2]UJF19725.1 trp operon repressor [Vibrio sp. SS-MA-C1-2]